MGLDLGELYIKLGFKLDSSEAKSVSDFNSTVTALSTSFIAVKDMAQLAVGGINNLISGTTSDVAALESFRNMTGQSIDMLNKWRVVASLLDPTLSLESGIQALDVFTKKLEMAKITGQGLEGWRGLFAGDPTRDTIEQSLERLGRAVKAQEALGMPKARISQFIGMTGLPEQWIKVFEQNNDQMAKLLGSSEGKMLYGETNRQQILKMIQANQDLDIAMRKLRDTFVLAISPALMKFTQELTKDMPKIIEFTSHVKEVTSEFIKTHPEATKLIKDLALLALGVGALSQVIRLLNATVLILANPFVKWYIAISATYEILKDMYNYMEGKKSVIGNITGTTIDKNISSKDKMKDFSLSEDKLRNDIILAFSNKANIGDIFKDLMHTSTLLNNPYTRTTLNPNSPIYNSDRSSNVVNNLTQHNNIDISTTKDVNSDLLKNEIQKIGQHAPRFGSNGL